MAIIIEGNWKKGIVLDRHTLESKYLGVDEYGHDQWENKRSELGELVYQEETRGNKPDRLKSIDALVEEVRLLEDSLETIDLRDPARSAFKTRA